MINLKTSEGKQKFREVLADTAALVKKYRGALSGEHGDGRLRGEFIPYMMGQEVYELFRQVKRIWDPGGVFNANKIVDTPPMNESLRYVPDAPKPEIPTVFDFTRDEGILRLTEKCSGSGDCRKTELTGGTMCPSYMATRRERDTTRARANILRQYYTSGYLPGSTTPETTPEMVKDVLDLCLSCKGCKTECPSSVDVSKMKAEFTQQQHAIHGVPFRSRLVASFTRQMSLAALAPWAYNAMFGTPAVRKAANRLVGFHPDRTIPLLHRHTLRKWFEKRKRKQDSPSTGGKVYLFCDEFTDFHDVEVGKKTVRLLEKLGYEVIIPAHLESGRTYLSKGMVKEAQNIAERNVRLLKSLVSAQTPLVGIEPSAILTFRDEYPDLVSPELREEARLLGSHALLLEEFLTREREAKRIQSSQFTSEKRLVKLHGHCHQKALSSMTDAKKALTLPANYTVQLIPSGCCGMAGSFGYEEEHYEISMQIGELVLFPAVRQQAEEVLIAAAGTSCRHQIKDGTGRKALHPVEILWEALKK